MSIFHKQESIHTFLQITSHKLLQSLNKCLLLKYFHYDTKDKYDI